MRTILVESLGAYEAARNAFGGGGMWCTTSPYLLEALSRKGEDVRSLEDGLSQEAVDGLGRAGFAYAEAACSVLNEVCSWREYADFGKVFGLSFANQFYALFYKGMLLDRLAAEAGPVVCVGDPEDDVPVGLRPGYDRFVTLYARLAAQSGRDDLSVLKYDTAPDVLARLERNVVNRRMGRWEKLLSVINNTPGSFAYKTWRTMTRRNRFRSIRLWPKARKRFFVHRDCELIEEAFAGLLVRGASFSRLPSLPGGDIVARGLDALPDADMLLERLTALALDAVADLPHAGLAKTCAAMTARRALLCVEALRLNLSSLTGGFEGVVEAMGPGGEVLTNFFAGAVDRLFGLYCLDRGVPVTAFEHGITLGLSEWARYPAPFWGMLLAQTGVYHGRLCLRDMEEHLQGQRVLLAGMPQVTNRVFMPRLQRLLARKWLGIDRSEHVVMYVADLERNNFVYGPHVENDLQFVRKTEAIVDELARRYPDSRVVLKLYPACRYQENYDFGSLTERHSNVTIIQDMDFRFIRAAADVLTVTSSQSTLGWVMGSGRTSLYLENPWMPARVPGFEMECASVPEINRTFLLYNVYDADPDAKPRNVMRIMDAVGGEER